jgi:threonine/homoserine/homoserine lactone efflux protein
MLFLTGIVLGISIAAPVGPIALLCLRRTLAEGRLMGLAAGLGAATADALGGAVAAFGLPVLLGAVERHEVALRAGGGAFMVVLGAWILRAPPRPAPDAASPPRAVGLAAAYGSTLLLTLANPMTVLSFVGAVATLGGQVAGATGGDSARFVAGVFTGSALWWLLWCGAAGRLRDRLDAAALRWINRLAGGGLAVFGAAQLLRLALARTP